MASRKNKKSRVRRSFSWAVCELQKRKAFYALLGAVGTAFVGWAVWVGCTNLQNHWNNTVNAIHSVPLLSTQITCTSNHFQEQDTAIITLWSNRWERLRSLRETIPSKQELLEDEVIDLSNRVVQLEHRKK